MSDGEDDPTAVRDFALHDIQPHWEHRALAVRGRLGGLQFEALVYRQQAARGEWELHGGRVGCLRLRDEAGHTLFHWERRLLLAATDERAGRVADLLAAHQAEHLFHD